MGREGRQEGRKGDPERLLGRQTGIPGLPLLRGKVMVVVVIWRREVAGKKKKEEETLSLLSGGPLGRFQWQMTTTTTTLYAIYTHT